GGGGEAVVAGVGGGRVGPRRLGPGTSRQPADGPAAAADADLSVHRARSSARRAHLLTRRGDVPGKDRRDGPDIITVCRTAAPVHTGAPVGDSHTRSRRAAAPNSA